MSVSKVDQACAACALGPHALYAPAFLNRPDDIRARRECVMEFSPHQIMMRGGELQARVFTIHSGWAFRASRLRDGRRQILSLYLPGDGVCLEALYPRPLPSDQSVRALSKVTACAFLTADMRALLLTTEVQRNHLAGLIVDELVARDQRLADIGRRRATGRIAQFVLALETRLVARGLAQPGSMPFPMRQDDLADTLGLTAAHVNRMLVTLKASGVLETRRGELRILNRHALQEIAVEQ